MLADQKYFKIHPLKEKRRIDVPRPLRNKLWPKGAPFADRCPLPRVCEMGLTFGVLKMYDAVCRSGRDRTNRWSLLIEFERCFGFVLIFVWFLHVWCRYDMMDMVPRERFT